MADDEPLFYSHALDSLLGSAEDKRHQSLKHLKYFLIRYCKQIGIPVVKADEIPHQEIPPHSNDKEISIFWDKMFGAFTTYLGKHARAACNPTWQGPSNR